MGNSHDAEDSFAILILQILPYLKFLVNIDAIVVFQTMVKNPALFLVSQHHGQKQPILIVFISFRFIIESQEN